MRVRFASFIALATVVAMQLSSCAGDSSAPSEKEEKQPEKKEINPEQANLVKVGDKLFNLPSPLETAFLLEEVDNNFQESMLNQNVDATSYSTRYAQAMNLGVYGADLGYALIHNQSQTAFQMLGVCKKLGTELGISPALYTGLMKRFEGNLENKDSLLIFISELNRLSDEYLKENESEDISTLILYGGWIESLHFTTTIAENTGEERIIQRIGEQKNGLNNLIGLMEQQNTSGSLDSYVDELKGLKETFDQVGYSYEWQEPETKPEEHLTVLRSSSSVSVSPEALKEITEKINHIRKSITETTAL